MYRSKLANMCVAGVVTFLMLSMLFAGSFGSTAPLDGGNSATLDKEARSLLPDDGPLQAPGDSPRAEIIYTKPATYATLVSWYQTLAAAYPNYLEVITANTLYGTGTITGGYNYYVVRLTNESKGLLKPELLFVGGPHGDETVGTISQYWFCNWTLRSAFRPGWSNDKTDWLRWMLDNREIYFVVSENPYGFDNVQRNDANGWDLNREADLDGPEPPIPTVWSSVNGKTLRELVNHHQFRAGCDFHGGARLLLYPWGSTHSSVTGTSTISGRAYTYAPPDFNYFDTSSLRLGSYMGDYGGDLTSSNIGTIPPVVGYTAMGGIGPWAYGSDVAKNPREAAYVDTPPYPGAGALWLSPELSTTKNPAQSTFGGDITLGWGIDVRRLIMHQVDLAQPYVRQAPGSVPGNSVVNPGETIHLKWQVNGSMVVDHTYVQWGSNPDPVNNPQYATSDFNANAGHYVGGTGWEGAANGNTTGTTYDQAIAMPMVPGDYYFVPKAKVDQVYSSTLAHADYDPNHPYLRLVKERAQPGYSENVTGTDGTEHMQYREWWYGPVIRVRVAGLHAGIIALDKSVYRLEDTATVMVADTDLNTNNGTVQTTVVQVTSTSEPSGEMVTLTETGPATSTFVGTLTLSATNSVGVLWVAHGNTVTATYNDANNGTGPATVTDTATVDGMPPGPPTSLTVQWYSKQVLELYNETFEGDGTPTWAELGWTTGGASNDWQIGTPAGLGGQYGNPDPSGAHGGTRAIGNDLTGLGATSGDYEASIAVNSNYVYSKAVDCTGATGCALSIWKQLNVEQPAYDHAYIEASNTGSTWTQIWTNTAEVTDSGWGRATYNISAVADNHATVYVRFELGATDGGWQFSGWNIDDLVISGSKVVTNHNTLNWTLSSDDGIGANDVAKYNIYRANSAGGPWDGTSYIVSVNKGVRTYCDLNRGQFDGINWWYVVRAEDTTGNEEKNTFAVPEQMTGAWANITVNSTGWVLVSVPILASNTGLPYSLTDRVNGGAGLVQWSRAMWYSPTTPVDRWKQYNSAWPSAMSDLKNADHTIGVWLYITSLGDGQLCVGGMNYSAPSTTVIQLRAGWNMVGYPALNDATYTVGQLKAATGATMVEGFNPSTTYRTSALPDTNVMKKGRGYWVYVPADATWTVNW